MNPTAWWTGATADDRRLIVKHGEDNLPADVEARLADQGVDLVVIEADPPEHDRQVFLSAEFKTYLEPLFAARERDATAEAYRQARSDYVSVLPADGREITTPNNLLDDVAIARLKEFSDRETAAEKRWQAALFNGR